MTWAEFNEEVRKHLTIHNRRQGIQTLITQLIRAALVDLQAAVPALRCGHKIVYAPEIFTAEGYAGVGRLTPGVIVTSAYVRDPDDTSKIGDLEVTTGAPDRDLVEGTAPLVRQLRWRGNRGEFLIVPNPATEGVEVVLTWDGSKVDFCDDDVLPDSWSAQGSVVLPLIVADFVLARLSWQVDGDLGLAQSYSASYALGKRKLKSDWNEAANLPGRPTSA